MEFPFELIHSTSPGTVVYPPGGQFGPRVQQDLQFVLLHSGHMRVDIDGKSLDVTPGHVAMLLPGRMESFGFDRLQDTWHRWVAVHLGELPEHVRQRLEVLPQVLPLTEEFNKLTDLLLSMRDKQILTKAIARSFGFTIINLYTSMASLSPKAEVHSSVIAVKSHIHQHFAEPLTLDALAKEANVSPEHLVRLFRQFEGTTPMRYVWHYRVVAAGDMLVHTGLPIGEIAMRCGFKTSYHFARVVKQTTGKTPSRIRDEHWNGSREQ